MKLLEILNKKRYDTDKHTIHKYVQEFYEEEFVKYQSKNIRLLEIGVLTGGSLKMWRDYFENAEIVGIDIFKRVSLKEVKDKIKGYDIHLYEVDSFNSGEVEQDRKKFIVNNSQTGFDIIIDDGLHSEYAQYTTYRNFSKLVNPGGIYVIEDVRESSINKLLEIDNIEILHLNEGHGSRVSKQAIGVIRF